MKKRIISILAIAALLVSSIAVPCIAATQQDVTASVTVTELISITVSEDDSNPGINFGIHGPGTTDILEADSASDNSTISIKVEPESNTSVNLTISGTDFVPVTFTIDNAKWSTSFGGGQTALSTTDTEFATNIDPDTTVELWH